MIKLRIKNVQVWRNLKYEIPKMPDLSSTISTPKTHRLMRKTKTYLDRLSWDLTALSGARKSPTGLWRKRPETWNQNIFRRGPSLIYIETPNSRALQALSFKAGRKEQVGRQDWVSGTHAHDDRRLGLMGNQNGLGSSAEFPHSKHTIVNYF